MIRRRGHAGQLDGSAIDGTPSTGVGCHRVQVAPPGGEGRVSPTRTCASRCPATTTASVPSAAGLGRRRRARVGRCRAGRPSEVPRACQATEEVCTALRRRPRSQAGQHDLPVGAGVLLRIVMRRDRPPLERGEVQEQTVPAVRCGTERKRVRRLASRSLVAALPAERVAPGSGPIGHAATGPTPRAGFSFGQSA